MDAIWQGLSGIFEVVLIAGLGFFLAKKGWFWENAAKDLTRLTMTVALPPRHFYLYLLHRECHLHRRAGECGTLR